MESIKPQENQSIFDIALQKYGSIEGVFDLLDDNVIDRVDNELSVYNELEIISPPTRREIKEFYISRSILPATDATLADLALFEDEDDCIGIGCMEVGDDFIVCPPDGDLPSDNQEISGFLTFDKDLLLKFSVLEDSLYYRKVQRNAIGDKILLSKETGDVLGPRRIKFSITVEPNVVYEVYTTNSITILPTSRILISVTLPIDNTGKNINVFNSAAVLKSISAGKDFSINFSREITQA